MIKSTRQYHNLLVEEFGNDLKDIFGSTEEQANKKSLASIAGNDKKIKEILDALPNGGVLDVYEEFGRTGRPLFLEVAKKILRMLSETKLPNGKNLFEEYKLPELGEQLARKGGVSEKWEKLRVRYPIQRAVKVYHIVRDILIEWDYNLNDPAYVRILSDDSMNVNDKQHGNFGRLIMGASDVLVEGIVSDDPSVDSDMYASRNIHNLKSAWENDANVRVERAKDFEREGKTVKSGDQPYLTFYTILENEDCEWQESGIPKKQKVCNHGEKLYQDYQQYGEELFVDAVKMNVQIWPQGELAREFVWFACELMKQLKERLSESDMREVRTVIKNAMKESFPDKDNHRNRATGPGTFWGACRDFMKGLPKTGENKDWRHKVGSNFIGASGLRELILNYSAWMKSEKKITPLKFDLPEIKIEDKTVVVGIGVYPGGWKKNLKPWVRHTSENYNMTEIDFDEEDGSDDESETV